MNAFCSKVFYFAIFLTVALSGATVSASAAGQMSHCVAMMQSGHATSMSQMMLHHKAMMDQHCKMHRGTMTKAMQRMHTTMMMSMAQPSGMKSHQGGGTRMMPPMKASMKQPGSCGTYMYIKDSQCRDARNKS